ncbi:MAG: tRNA (N6-isopentenyl adenosine(37)-C2)-methylthiotransferase MiaB, partial [Phycisphaerae bacterium]|nr:tRNA (N6-isopentenyl adenosine(37)-C2)-methylthiotransferase MiaB [Phycisphaerae bacterium]
MKVYLETFGCQMNRLDSELVVGSLRSAGHEMVDDPGDADAVLYNTCSVRRHAEQKVLSRLGADRRRKASGRRFIVGVLGCMAQRLGEKLRQRYGQVDVVCAPGQLHSLADLICQAAQGTPCVALDPDRKTKPDTAAEAKMDAMDLARDINVRPTCGTQAYVRVMRGCD